MLYHKGADFYHVAIAMAKNSTTATSNGYQVHLNGGKQLIFGVRTRIFDL